jgi:hypothetical protein
MKTPNVRFCASLVLALLGLVGVALAAEQPASEDAPKAQIEQPKLPPQAAKNSSVPITYGGLRVFIDPQTGRIQAPTPEQEQELAEAVRRFMSMRAAPRSAPQQFTPPGGGIAIEVSEELYTETTARISPDGKLVLNCAPKEAAEKLVNTPAAHGPEEM